VGSRELGVGSGEEGKARKTGNIAENMEKCSVLKPDMLLKYIDFKQHPYSPLPTPSPLPTKHLVFIIMSRYY